MPASFLDTNILIYAMTADPAKPFRAKEIVKAGGTISVQNLNEFANVGRKKLKRSWSEISLYLQDYRTTLNVVPVTTEIHDLGLVLAERSAFSLYDSMIVAAAVLAQCDVLWSEDMQHGLLVENRLRILNPFADV